MRAYFWVLSNSIGPYFRLYTSTTQFFLLYLVVSFGIRKYETFNLVLLFKIVLAIQSPLKFHKNFKIDFSKMSLGQMYFSETPSTALTKVSSTSLSFLHVWLEHFLLSYSFLAQPEKRHFYLPMVCFMCLAVSKLELWTPEKRLASLSLGRYFSFGVLSLFGSLSFFSTEMIGLSNPSSLWYPRGLKKLPLMADVNTVI